MKTKLKILKLFLQDKTPKTIREIAKQLKVDYRITHTAIQRLANQSAITMTTVGKSSLCELNSQYYSAEIYQAEDERRQEIFKNGNLRQLYKEVMSQMRSTFFIMILFGSYAKHSQTARSDIDLMFVSNGENFEDRITHALSLLPLDTHPFVFTEQDVIRMNNGKEPNVIREIMKTHIILYGIEAFYRLKNAR